MIHYQHDYHDVAACESAYSIARRQLKEVGAKTTRGECLTESSGDQLTRKYKNRLR